MKTALYIEDDPSLRQLVHFILQKRDDFLLLEADTGFTGLQIALQEKPDIILLDLSLPDISGYEVLRRLQGNDVTSNIPVIAVSGDSLPEDIEKGLEAGFDGYLAKPIDVRKFYTILDEKIDHKNIP
jgi:CheY-like chemotaxis protein